MPTYEAGQTIIWGLKTYTSAGVLADLGGGNPTATVTKPDGTTASATVAKASTGTYTASHTAADEGRYRVTWTGSGANSGGLPYTDHADVWPADPRFIVPLADARATLNVPNTNRVDDDELRLYLSAATAVIENIAGPILGAEVVELYDGGRAAIALNHAATSITEVSIDGTVVTDYCLGNGSLLWRGSTPHAGVWPWGARNVSVTYQVGSAVVPSNVILAASKLIDHWWRQGQQSYYVDGPPDGGGDVYVAGYAIPNAVVDLLAPSINKMPGFA